eukprot:RCo040106
MCALKLCGPPVPEEEHPSKRSRRMASTFGAVVEFSVNSVSNPRSSEREAPPVGPVQCSLCGDPLREERRGCYACGAWGCGRCVSRCAGCARALCVRCEPVRRFELCGPCYDRAMAEAAADIHSI